MHGHEPSVTDASKPINNYTKNDRPQYEDLRALVCLHRPQIVKYLSEVERNVLCLWSEYT